MAPLRLAVAFVTFLAALAGPAHGQTRTSAQGAPPPAVVVNLDALPWTHRQSRWSVVVRPPAPDLRALGGSGGSIYEVEISRPAQPPTVFVVLAIGMALAPSAGPWPAVEVWSAAGGGTYTRAVYRWQANQRMYCATTVDEFEDHGDDEAVEGLVRIAGNDRLVRYARTRPFGCE